MAISGELVAKLSALLKGAEVKLENSKILVNGKVVTLHQFGHEELENFHKLADGLKDEILIKVHGEALKVLAIKDKVDLAVGSEAAKIDADLKAKEAEEAAKIDAEEKDELNLKEEFKDPSAKVE
jgi:hypothetical protein